MKKHRKPKKPVPGKSFSRHRPRLDASRITRSSLARELRVSVSTIVGWFAKPGAPKPDEFNRYDPTEARKWSSEQSKWALQGASANGSSLRDEKLALEIAELKRQDGLRRGELFEKKDWDDEANKFVSDVEATYQKLLYHELPPKLVGKSEPEIREMIGKYLSDAALSIRESAKRVEDALTTKQQ